MTRTWPPKGEPVKLPVTRDNRMSSASGETRGNNGGANKFKLKGRQEYAIFDVDVGALKGKIVTGAMFHFHTTTPDAAALRVSPGQKCSARRAADGMGIGLREADAISCDPVDVRGVEVGRSVTVGVERPLVVGVEDDDVGLSCPQ